MRVEVAAAISAAPDTSAVGGGKPRQCPLNLLVLSNPLTGMSGSINGQTITVDPAVVRDGPFNVGDTVKVEVQVQADGSMVVSRVEASGHQSIIQMTPIAIQIPMSTVMLIATTMSISNEC